MSLPWKVMKQYKGNKDMEEFIMEFMKLMGDHFTTVRETERERRTGRQTETHREKGIRPSCGCIVCVLVCVCVCSVHCIYLCTPS